MLLTTTQAAKKLRVSTGMFRRLCRIGQIPAINTAKKGGVRQMWRIEETALRDWQRQNAALVPRAPEPPPTPPSVPNTTHNATLAPSGVLSRLDARLQTLDEKLDQLLAIWS